jgi:hypothetical protein
MPHRASLVTDFDVDGDGLDHVIIVVGAVNPDGRYPALESGYVEIPWWLDAPQDSESWFSQRIFWARCDGEKGAPRRLGTASGWA